MPATSIKRKITQKSRTGAIQRSKQARSGRQGGERSAPKASPFIADSLFELKLSARPAITIDPTTRRKKGLVKHNGAEEDYVQMYYDVREIVIRCRRILKGDNMTFDPLNNFEIGTSLTLMLDMFRGECLPKDWDFNIERGHNGDYHICIYTACPFDTMWHAFELKPVVLWLKKHDPKLHNTFVKFMRNFTAHAGVYPWYGGGFYVDEDMLIDHIENYEFDTEEEEMAEKAKLHQVIYDYKKGIAKEYQDKLINAKVIPVQQLRKEILQFPKRNQLVKWMMDTCDYMEQPYNLNDYIYPELTENGDLEGLFFDMQMAVIWDVEDAFTKEQEEFLDCEANGMGIIEPIYNYRIKKDVRSLDLEFLKGAFLFPKGLTKIFDNYCLAIKKYRK